VTSRPPHDARWAALETWRFLQPWRLCALARKTQTGKKNSSRKGAKALKGFPVCCCVQPVIVSDRSTSSWLRHLSSIGDLRVGPTVPAKADSRNHQARSPKFPLPDDLRGATEDRRRSRNGKTCEGAEGSPFSDGRDELSPAQFFSSATMRLFTLHFLSSPSIRRHTVSFSNQDYSNYRFACNLLSGARLTSPRAKLSQPESFKPQKWIDFILGLIQY